MPESEDENEMVLLPRNPTQAMIDAAWAAANAEDAGEVWHDMVEAWLNRSATENQAPSTDPSS